MDEAMKRQMNRQNKQAADETVKNSKMTALERQKQAAIETKMQKQATRQMNEENRADQERVARSMKTMIQNQK